MKKLLYTSAILLALSTAGCSKALQEDPNGQLVGNDALKTVSGLQSALIGAYNPLKNGYVSGFASSSVVAVGMGADDLTTHPASNKQDFREMDQFSVSSTNSKIGIIWLGCYKTIQNVNNILANYKNTTGDQTTIKQIVGEAYFLRAFSYFWLVRLWGNIPLITTADYNTELLSVNKSAPADVYKLIESDLQQAEQMMPNIKAAPGRANAGSAKALLAQVYLTEGGYPIKDASKYAMAAAKAKEVIDNKSVYKFDLESDLASLWSGIPKTNGSVEDVFTLQFAAPTNVNSIYGKSCMPGDEAGWDDYFAEITFFNNFPAGKRKNVTFYTKFKNGTLDWTNSATKHPYYNKFRVNTPTVGYLTSATSMSLPLIRYADVLLTYAEAQARANALPDVNAYAAVNAIRSRAGMPNMTLSLSAPAFADSVVQERAWEFAGEYTRWFDLVRLEKVEEANSHKDANDLKPLGTITKANYWLPIPYMETQLNPNLK